MDSATKSERDFQELNQMFNLEQACYLDVLLCQRTADMKRDGGKEGQKSDYSPYSHQFEQRFGFRPNDDVMSKFDYHLQRDPLFYMLWHPDQSLYPKLPDIGDIEWCPTEEELSWYLTSRQLLKRWERGHWEANEILGRSLSYCNHKKKLGLCYVGTLFISMLSTYFKLDACELGSFMSHFWWNVVKV